ncbi:gliding motility protein SprC [Flavobacterium collinsii]|uniref:Adhesin SprC n=1 Tax=Flavobacterium collinsii TaxID=1114861 RepID=A0A9W4TFA2_9FLAO|nr:gliding motility protein SprC [Flavobacterium collinsii]CAI2765995.1 Putative adhesin precursor SprC [Flavobacterium collinsii]
MIRKITPNFTNLFLLFSILFFCKPNIHAQTIVPQPLDGLEKLCAGKSFNEFYATFSYVNFPVGTTFAVELLDSSNSPIATTLLGSPVDVSPTQQTIKFAVPVTLVGSDTYGLRIKSSTGAVSPRFKNSLGVTSFPAYYKVYESTFSINGKATNATICAGSNLTLSIDNDTPAVIGSSPLNYPALKYRWFKDGVVISGQSGTTLVVSSPGEYYALVEYGACTEPNISSNLVAVTSSASGSGVVITSSLGNPFCATTEGTVLTASKGNHYVWKKDGAAFGGDTRTVNAKDSGVYTVQVDFGGCNATGSINLQASGFNASIDVADQFKLEEGESVTATVTTDATSPIYKWYLNDAEIKDATSSSYIVIAKGNYKVVVSQVSGCVSTKELAFKVIGPTAPATVIPNVVSLQNPYWNIPEVYKTAQTKIMILSSNGEIMFDGLGSNYDPQVNSFIKDFKNVNPVYYYVIQSDTGEKKGSITVIR